MRWENNVKKKLHLSFWENQAIAVFNIMIETEFLQMKKLAKWAQKFQNFIIFYFLFQKYVQKYCNKNWNN